MTNDEIRALHSKANGDLEIFDKISYADTKRLLSAIETLLAREDSLRESIGTTRPLLHCLNCGDSYESEDPESGECPDCGGDIVPETRLLQTIYDILYPETKP